MSYTKRHRQCHWDHCHAANSMQPPFQISNTSGRQQVTFKNALVMWKSAHVCVSMPMYYRGYAAFSWRVISLKQFAVCTLQLHCRAAFCHWERSRKKERLKTYLISHGQWRKPSGAVRAFCDRGSVYKCWDLLTYLLTYLPQSVKFQFQLRVNIYSDFGLVILYINIILLLLGSFFWSLTRSD